MKKPLNLAERVLGKEGFKKSKTACPFSEKVFTTPCDGTITGITEYGGGLSGDCVGGQETIYEKHFRTFLRTPAELKGRFVAFNDPDRIYRRFCLQFSTPECFKEKISFRYFLDVAIDIFSKPFY
jgi:hypothetical protein